MIPIGNRSDKKEGGCQAEEEKYYRARTECDGKAIITITSEKSNEKDTMDKSDYKNETQMIDPTLSYKQRKSLRRKLKRRRDCDYDSKLGKESTFQR